MYGPDYLRSAIASVALLLALPAGTAMAAEDGAWGEPYIGSDPELLYLPDANATYWRYGWQRQPGDTGGIVITGLVPDVRYFSYNVYDDDTKQSLGSVPDHQIVLNDDAPNPFAGGTAPEGAHYTVHVVPEGTAVDASNVLTFPDAIENVSVFLRHYLPVPRDDIHGGVAIPRIQKFDPVSGTLSDPTPGVEPAAISMTELKTYIAPMVKPFIEQHKGNITAAVAALGKQVEDGSVTVQELVVRQVLKPAFGYNDPTGTLDSFRLDTSGNYPTADNFYLVLPVTRQSPDQVLLAKFRASPVAKAPADYPTAPLRYYSIGQGDDKSYNYMSLYDAQITVADDGFAYFVIGKDSPALRAQASAMQANFMPWLVQNKMLLLYRNMLPRADYPYGIDKVPYLDSDRDIAAQTAVTYIGDHALTGILFDEAALLDSTAMPDF